MSLLGRFRDFFRARPQASVRETMMFAGRARLITHMFDAFGEETSSEFCFDAKPPGFEPLLVFEFAPWRSRDWWTYSTAGLSLCPAMDDHPPTELLAYSETRAAGLVDLLHQLAFKDPSTPSYRAGDLVSFDADPPDLGIALGRHYGLLNAPESQSLTAFPDLSARPEDQRYLMTRPGEDATRVQFLRVVALNDNDPTRWRATQTTIQATHSWRMV